MKELSLNLLDIAENSVKAGATFVKMELTETEELLTMVVADNGCGMSEEMVKRVTDPFCTTRTTRKVGLGIPLLKLAAEQTGGTVIITSRPRDAFPDTHGTEVTATFFRRHIDCTPLGDTVATVKTLIQGNPQIDFLFLHRTEQGEVSLDTRQIREILGEEIPLCSYEIMKWIDGCLREQYEGLSEDHNHIINHSTSK